VDGKKLDLRIFVLVLAGRSGRARVSYQIYKMRYSTTRRLPDLQNKIFYRFTK
jgi:hypothetical protein